MVCCKYPLWSIVGFLGAMLLIGLALVSCSKQPAPLKPMVHRTQAFAAVFGELPPIPVPGPCYATVGYFPSAREPGRYRPVPIFTAEQGKEETLTVRTVIRGIEGADLSGEIVAPFPAGSDLVSLTYEGKVARITVGGAFNAATLPPERKVAAARAIALTVAQFGKAVEADVTDAAGTVHFTGKADDAPTVDLGPPKVLGLLAIKEKPEDPPTVLSVLFDRPVFVDDVTFHRPGEKTRYTGSTYQTGFGMTLELHPDPKAVFDGRTAYPVRVAVKDGKGRSATLERDWTPKEVTRD